MTREQLKNSIMAELNKIEGLFNHKNDGYGDDKDGLYNFRQSALRFCDDDSLQDMFTILMILADKHWVTLAKNGLSDPMCEERLRDMIVYCLIGLAMHTESGRR